MRAPTLDGDGPRRRRTSDRDTQSALISPTTRRWHCQKQSTAPVPLDRTQTFLVTHVFHPLFGRELRLIDQYLAWGEDRVCFRDDKGALRSLPTAWTTLAPEHPTRPARVPAYPRELP